MLVRVTGKGESWIVELLTSASDGFILFFYRRSKRSLNATGLSTPFPLTQQPHQVTNSSMTSLSHPKTFPDLFFHFPAQFVSYSSILCFVDLVF